mgnify:CR=1 FL=1
MQQVIENSEGLPPKEAIEQDFMVSWQVAVRASNPVEAIEQAAQAFLVPGSDKFVVSTSEESFTVDINLLRTLGVLDVIRSNKAANDDQTANDNNQETEDTLG